MIKICGVPDRRQATSPLMPARRRSDSCSPTRRARSPPPKRSRHVARRHRTRRRVPPSQHARPAGDSKLVDLHAIQVHRAEDLPLVLHGREVIPGVRAEFQRTSATPECWWIRPAAKAAGLPGNSKKCAASPRPSRDSRRRTYTRECRRRGIQGATVRC